MAKIHTKIFNPEILHPILHSSWHFIKPKPQKMSKLKPPFSAPPSVCRMLGGGAVPGMHLCNRCLRKGNSGVLSHQNLTAQPLSVFFHFNTMSVLLRLPLSAGICNALCMVTHHWEMQSLEWMSLPLSLAITLSSEAVNMLSVCSPVSLPLYLTAILGALKVIPIRMIRNLELHNVLLFAACEHTDWISWAHQNFNTHTETIF